MQAVQHVPCIIYASTYVNDATHSGPLKIMSNECVVTFLACTRHTDEIPLLYTKSQPPCTASLAIMKYSWYLGRKGGQCLLGGQDFYQLAGPKIALRFLYLFAYWSVGLCIPTYHVLNNYVTYIVAMRLHFSGLWQSRQLLCAATMSSLEQFMSLREVVRNRGNVDATMRG